MLITQKEYVKGLTEVKFESYTSTTACLEVIHSIAETAKVIKDIERN